MKELTDLLGKQVTIITSEEDDIEGTLLSVANGGYFIKEEDGTFNFIPEANNVLRIYHGEPEE